MKIRYDFVTNSSSSSFIAVYQGSDDCIDEIKNFIRDHDLDCYTIGERGNLEFGWTQEVFNDFDSRLNFVAMQVILSSEQWQNIFGHSDDDQALINLKGVENCREGQMLNTIFEKAIGIPLNWDKIKILLAGSNYREAYIDHESVDICSIIFENDQYMSNFLFGAQSAVIMGNDNVYREEGEFHHLEEKYLYNKDFVTDTI